MPYQLPESIQDCYTPDAGKHPADEIILCGVCGVAMDATMSVFGPRGYAAAMADKASKFDSYRCPHRNELWHIQAKEIRKQAKSSPSKKIADMLNMEANEILTRRKHTKGN